MNHLLLQANALRIPLADESVQCVVTSPPYWGLRDYGVPGQLGLESTPDEFVDRMVAVFREVKRALRSDGTCFVNLGDSYAAGGSGGYSDKSTLSGFTNPETKGRQMNGSATQRAIPFGLKPKDLCGIPWRVALALQADGWYLRSDIIWAKPNPMPESVTDRPTKSHEYVFLLTKNERYYWDAEAVREDSSPTSAGNRNLFRGNGSYTNGNSFNNSAHKPNEIPGNDGVLSGRNLRTVWSIPTESYPGAHFATYPRKLVEPCVKAGTSQKGCCPECGKCWEREVERERTKNGCWHAGPRDSSISGMSDGYTFTKTTGWRPACTHNREPVPCLVFDPFAGSGTTGVVAEGLHRNFIGLDLSREYLGMARHRIERPHKHIPRPGRTEHHPLFKDQE